MRKKLLKVAAVLALSLAGAACRAEEGAALGSPLATSCEKPEWSLEALRYGLEGTTTVVFDLNDAGKAHNARIARSSGWRLLDNMSLRALEACRFDPHGNPRVKRSNIDTTYVWTLEPHGEKDTPAELVPDSCAVSTRFARFRPMMGSVTGSEGVLVCFLVNPAGKPFRIMFEPGVPPETARDGMAFIESCRFTPSQGKNGPAPGNLFGRLLPKPV